MIPKKIQDQWYIEVATEEFGNVLLLDKSSNLPIPLTFSTKDEALTYIRNQQNKGD